MNKVATQCHSKLALTSLVLVLETLLNWFEPTEVVCFSIGHVPSQTDVIVSV